LPPIFTALDINSDRAIDGEEMQQAPDRLTKLDGNKDGKISRDESLPKFPGGPGSPQGPGGGPPGFPGDAGPGPGGKPPLPPIITVLTSDRDGSIGADAIARAPELLKQLDRDGDGSLALTECLPPMPGGPNAPSPGANAANGQRPPPNLPPIIIALDANGDMKIDAQEIAAATAALRKLDRDGDGKITSAESLPGPLGAPPMPGGSTADRVPGTFASGGLFRAVRFGLDYPAFKGRTLTPLPER
jgi:Ca2+-binding EF-hand superfamily protein